jgi:hypothetical protein
MATRKTWIWIIVITLSVCVVGMLAVAGAGVYFVASHFDTRQASSSEAFQEFDRARAAFKEAKPLFEIDQRERPKLTRQISSLPTAPSSPEYLWILAYDPDHEGRIVKVNLPFWLLRFGKKNIKLDHGDGFDLNRLDIDAHELQRIGPMLLLDHRSTSGERVLVWTK